MALCPTVLKVLTHETLHQSNSTLLPIRYGPQPKTMMRDSLGSCIEAETVNDDQWCWWSGNQHLRLDPKTIQNQSLLACPVTIKGIFFVYTRYIEPLPSSNFCFLPSPRSPTFPYLTPLPPGFLQEEMPDLLPSLFPWRAANLVGNTQKTVGNLWKTLISLGFPVVAK